MPSVFRDKRKYGAPSVGGDTTENRKRREREREEALDCSDIELPKREYGRVLPVQYDED